MGGAWAVPGYAMKGLYQEMVKSKGKGVQNYIIAARIAQGYDEANHLSARETAEIVSKWKHIKIGVKKKKNVAEEQMESLHMLVSEKRKRRQERWGKLNSHFKRPEAQPTFPPAMSEHSNYQELPHSHTTSHDSASSEAGPRIITGEPSWRTQARLPQQTDTFPRSSSQAQVALEAELIAEEEAERQELEEAIAASIAHNSHGDAQEDLLVARAIRASIAELERTPAGAGTQDEEEALRRAMQASLAEAGRKGCSEEEKTQLEETIRRSLLETSRRRQHGSDSEWDTDDDTDDDEEYQRIIAESKELAHLHEKSPKEYHAACGMQESGIMGAIADATGAREAHALNYNDEEEEELKRVLEESEKAHKESMAKLDKQKTEEDIVMEYVRKQSLLEEQHRQRNLQGRDTRGEGSGYGAGR